MSDEESTRRQRTIEFDMNFCQHYQRGKGADMVCGAGVDLQTLQRVATGDKQIKWGPCIGGHTLPDPKSVCPHWIRRTLEQAEKRADSVQRSIDRMMKLDPLLSQWRKRKPIGKSEIVNCPVCGGRLHLSQSEYNGHVHGKCETKDCVAWME